MVRDRDESERGRERPGDAPSGERRRGWFFAWLGPMLERRNLRVEPVDPEEFPERERDKGR